MVLRCDCVRPLSCVDVNRLLKTCCSFFRIILLVAIGCVHKVGGCVMFVAKLDVVVGNSAEGVASGAPLLGHLVHVGRPSVAFQGLVLLAGAPKEATKKAFSS